MTTVEKYRLADAKPKTDAELSEEATRRKQLCESLGLTMQATVDGDEQQAQFYPELTGLELAVWMQFLPTHYSKNAGQWKNYQFDIVPQDALYEIDLAASMRKFLDFEIWTPERQKSDPLVVGVVGNRGMNGEKGSARFFKIARWGESLQSFEKIKKLTFFQRIRNYAYKNINSVPHPVLERVQSKWEKSPYEIVYFSGPSSSFWRRHCAKATSYRFRIESNIFSVCSRCLAIS